MNDLNILIEQLEDLTRDGSPNSIFAAANRRSILDYEADRLEQIAKATRSIAFIAARKEKISVTEAEHLSRIDKKYTEKKMEALKAKLKSEQAKAGHNELILRRDTIKTCISSIQSSMRLNS